MKLVQCEQGSEEWHNNRCGLITASMFSECRKRLKSGKNKGDFSAAAHDYAFRLAVERISGKPLNDPQFDGWQARRGRELEPEARGLHAYSIGEEIEQVGLALTDDRKFGCSADGYIKALDQGTEYKCFLAPEKLRSVLLDQDISEVMDQIQGGLWITGWSAWQFALYCPDLGCIGRDIEIIPVKRDDDYIEELEQDLMAFDRLVEGYRSKLEKKKEAA